MHPLRPFLPLGLALAVSPLLAQSPYSVESIKLPDGAPPEVGAIDFDSEGHLWVVLRRGDVLRALPQQDPGKFAWKTFASGFHNGCGIDAVSPSKIRVTQMADCTEAEDTDRDGVADTFRRFASGWGLSGNYHETNTLTDDDKGGYYFAIGTASHNGPVFEHLLGEYSPSGRRGRNFSAVQWRGWILHCDPQGRLTPYASGFRMHNGIYRDPDGRLWAGDNQGDWKAATPLYLVEEGRFYGHPSSLVWDPKWKDRDPLDAYRNDLDAYNRDRTPAVVEIPHMEMNRSAGEPIEIPRDGSFGPFAGQLLVPDNNGQRISRVMVEKVGDRWQGAVTHFIDGNGLRSGNHRLRFSPDGKELYVGQTVRGWGIPAEGLQRIRYRGELPFDIAGIRITPKGFRLTFTLPVPGDLAETAGWKASSFTLQPRWTYGSDPENRRDHSISAIETLSPTELEIELAGFTPGKIYRLDLPKVSSGKLPLRNRLLFYTAHRLPAS